MKNYILSAGLSLLLFSGLYARDHIEVKAGSGTVYSASFQEGCEDIHENAKKSKEEDCWLFVNGKWTDIGYNNFHDYLHSRRTSYDSTITDENAVSNAMKSNDGHDAFIVHIHPSVSKNNLSPPGDEDVEHYLWSRKFFREKFSSSIKEFMYDGYGCWEIYVKEGVDSMPGIKRKINSIVDRLIKMPKMNKSEAIKKYTELLEPLGIHITYKQIEKHK